MTKNRYNFYTFQTVPTANVGEVNRQPSVVDETDFRDLKDLIPNLIRYPVYDWSDDGNPDFEAQKEVIRKFGEHGHCVIVGRNANQILQEFDDSLHVFIHADPWWRVEYLKNNRMQDVSEEKIMRDLVRVDRKRCKYCTYYTNTEFGDSRYYDLCLNSGKIGLDECAKLIVELSR